MELLDQERDLVIFMVEVQLDGDAASKDWHRWDHGYVTQKLPKYWQHDSACAEFTATGRVFQETSIESATFSEKVAREAARFINEHSTYPTRVRSIKIRVEQEVVYSIEERPLVQPVPLQCLACGNLGEGPRLYSFTEAEFRKLPPSIRKKLRENVDKSCGFPMTLCAGCWKPNV